jgi:peptide/nickel transport system substrate-binding protein
VSRRQVFLRLVALGVVGALILAACGGSDSKDSTTVTTPSSSSSGPPAAGTLVMAAEQEPDCADWIATCTGVAWGSWIMQYQTMPQAYDIVKDGSGWKYSPSILLASEPTVTSTPVQVVTYKINPAAVWSDGTPITSTDFKYTWDQIVNNEDVYSKTGYENIESVDDTDPATAVVTFKPDESFGPWRALFGTDYGVWPSHILEGKNRDKATKNGYTWSGGPWKIEKWNRGVDVTLVPNDKYWGEQPKISKVIFKFIPDTAAQFKAFQTGEVLAIYPQPQPDSVDLITKGLPNAKTVYTADTATIEALWMNNEKKPLDSVPVRQAIAYAIDRDAIVARLFGALGVNKASQSLNPPITSQYGDQQAWAGYTLNLEKANSLLTADGWAKNGDGIYAKNGKTLSLTIVTTAGNQRRELTEQILQEQLKAAGIDVKIKNQSADQLFGSTLVKGAYQLTIFGQQNTNLDPGLCELMCSGNVPSKANEQSGLNTTFTKIAALDPLLQTVDLSTDEALRDQSESQADQLMAQEQVSLPIDPLPNIAIWSDRIQGNLSDNPITAMFWNMNTWQLQG